MTYLIKVSKKWYCYSVISGVGEYFLLSCTATVTALDVLAKVNGWKFRNWAETENAAFTRKFTCSVAGAWDSIPLLDDLEALVTVSYREVNNIQS